MFVVGLGVIRANDDPNGPVCYNGYYHMFFQYNPDAAIWGVTHWVSRSCTNERRSNHVCVWLGSLS